MKLREAERRAMRPPETISVSEWADRERVLSSLTSSEPGPWRTARTPYLRGPMDAFAASSTEEIVVLTSTQVGKTETILNCLGYAIQQDPAPTLLVMPREEDAVAIGARRVRPMITESRLNKHAIASDWKRKELGFDRMTLHFAGANSPADLSSRPIRYLFLDEVDKFPIFAGREADPYSLARERTRTYWDRRIMLTSTPTTRDGLIWREWLLTDRQHYFVPCPKCQRWQTLVWDQIRWPDGVRDPEKIRRDQSAIYLCLHCEAEIKDEQKGLMLQAGQWVSEDGDIGDDGAVSGPREGSRRGYHLNAIYSPWLTFSDIVAEFLRSKDDISRLINFTNSWMGHIWEERSQVTDADHVRTLLEPRLTGDLPSEAVVLTAGVDVQKDVIYYVIRAWGAGEESWLVRAGRVDSWNLLDKVLSMEFGSEGRLLRPQLTCIDSGYRTDEVYQFCRAKAELYRPIKGQQRISGIPIRMSRLDRDMGGGMIRHGLQLWHIDTSHFKDKLIRHMHTQPGDPGAWHLPEDVTEDYIRQITSEHKVVNRKASGIVEEVWTLKVGAGRSNHWWDCEVYAAAAADMLGVYAIGDTASAPARRVDRKAGSWIQSQEGGGDWIGGAGGKWL